MHRRRIKLLNSEEQFYRQPRPKPTATEAGYIKAKALRALAQWGEWIVARELAHLIHIHSPHIATAGCQALAKTKKQRSARKHISKRQ